MKEKLANILTWSITIILASVIAYLVIRGLIRRQSLNKNWEYAEAVVMDHFSELDIHIISVINFLLAKMNTKEREDISLKTILFQQVILSL